MKWRVNAWVPRLDRLNALAILCQGYLAVHNSHNLGLAQNQRDKTEEKAWWLVPLLVGTGHDYMSVTYDDLRRLLINDMKSQKWNWKKMEELMSDWNANTLKEFVHDFNKQFDNLRPPCI